MFRPVTPPEVVGDAGLFFDPLEKSSIVHCLVRFLGDEPLRRQLSEAARTRAATFSWDRAAELAEESFRRAAGRAGTPGTA